MNAIASAPRDPSSSPQATRPDAAPTVVDLRPAHGDVHGHDHGHAHDHGHGHRHSHDEAGHGHDHAPSPVAARVPLSAIRLSLATRLGFALGLSGLIWAGVAWALTPIGG